MPKAVNVIEEVIDAVPEPAPTDQVVEEAVVEPVEQAPPAEDKPKGRPFDSKRQEIYDRIKARKEAERAEASPPEEGPTDVEDLPTTEDAATEPEVSPTEPAAHPDSEPKRFKLKVNHQEREVTEEELIAAGQQHFAAQDALSDAKRLKSELLTALAEIRNSANVYPQYSQPAHPPAADTPEADTIPQDDQRARLKQIASDIQLGDEDSGVQALESLAEDIERRILARQVPNADPHEIAQQAVSEMRTQMAAMAANAEFQGKHPEVYQDRRLAAATVLTLNDLCLQEMRDIGVSDADLYRVQQTPEKIADWHRQYRERGYPVTDAMTMADRAVEYAKADLLKMLTPQAETPVIEQSAQAPQPASAQNARTSARVAEKRVEQNNNPRRANTVSRPTAQAPKTTADIVAEMRARRRFHG